jgi:hypothetical protein
VEHESELDDLRTVHGASRQRTSASTSWTSASRSSSSPVTGWQIDSGVPQAPRRGATGRRAGSRHRRDGGKSGVNDMNRLSYRSLAAAPAGAPPEGARPPRGSSGDLATRARAPGQAPRDREPDRPGGGGTASPRATPDHPGSRDRTQETRHPTRPPAGLTGPPQATRQPTTVRGRRRHRTTSC